MDPLGIDLATLTFAVTLRTTSMPRHHAPFANPPDGAIKLQTWLVGHGVTHRHGCMDATNIAWDALATFLHAQASPGSVVHPARSTGFAPSQRLRTKTDQRARAMIAPLCAQPHPRAATPPRAAP
jgi:hypothetical protein